MSIFLDHAFLHPGLATIWALGTLSYTSGCAELIDQKTDRSTKAMVYLSYLTSLVTVGLCAMASKDKWVVFLGINCGVVCLAARRIYVLNPPELSTIDPTELQTISAELAKREQVIKLSKQVPLSTEDPATVTAMGKTLEEERVRLDDLGKRINQVQQRALIDEQKKRSETMGNVIFGTAFIAASTACFYLTFAVCVIVLGNSKA